MKSVVLNPTCDCRGQQPSCSRPSTTKSLSFHGTRLSRLKEVIRCGGTSRFDHQLLLAGKAVAAPNSAVKLPLTAENVESVLDEVRPYLIADGGNVALHEIDGNVVRLKLQAGWGSCPSSVTTMKMGIGRRLMEKIPDIGGGANNR